MGMRLSIERDEYPVDGRFHGAIVYRVIGMPVGQRASIESTIDARWKVERSTMASEGFRRMGDYYPSPEAALAALQEAITDSEAGREGLG